MSDAPEWVCNLDAECAVLGALLVDNDKLDVVNDVLRDSDFYVSNHRAIFRAIFELVNGGRAADVVTVHDALVKVDAEHFRGILAYLGQMAQATPSSANIRRYAEIVADRSARRKIHLASRDITDLLHQSPSVPLDDLKERSQAAMMSATEGHSDASAFVMVGSMLPQVIAEIDERAAGDGNQLIGVPTGFRDLDDLTLGMQGGQLIIVGARPAMGKSAFALNVAEYSARATKRMALFFSLEMGIRQLTFRALAGAAGVNVQRLYTGRVREPEWPRITDAVSSLHDLPIAFCERADVRMADIRSLARRAKREFGGISVIVIDYLQLMLGADSEANRSAQLSEITRGLKVMAKELDVPVMALSQLNRELEKRGNKRPITADLRDSGAIEQDADNIFFLYRDEVYNPNSGDKGIAEIIVAKQRDGPTGTIRLGFRADHTRFSNYGGGDVGRVAA